VTDHPDISILVFVQRRISRVRVYGAVWFEEAHSSLCWLIQRIVRHLSVFSAELGLCVRRPRIGHITASAIAANVPDARLFGTARPFAVRLGLTPRANSSSGKNRPMDISKARQPDDEQPTPACGETLHANQSWLDRIVRLMTPMS
jgi:hypothetical protein